jgi:hypothetical protein
MMVEAEAEEVKFNGWESTVELDEMLAMGRLNGEDITLRLDGEEDITFRLDGEDITFRLGGEDITFRLDGEDITPDMEIDGRPETGVVMDGSAEDKLGSEEDETGSGATIERKLTLLLLGDDNDDKEEEDKDE